MFHAFCFSFQNSESAMGSPPVFGALPAFLTSFITTFSDIMTVITIPIYILVLIVIVKNRKDETWGSRLNMLTGCCKGAQVAAILIVALNRFTAVMLPMRHNLVGDSGSDFLLTYGGSRQHEFKHLHMTCFRLIASAGHSSSLYGICVTIKHPTSRPRYM
jgi:hypothetical protein